MNSLHDLMAKLHAIEENAKKSDIPAAQRKAKNPQDWKVTQKDLDSEDKEGKISHPDTLAKNTGRKVDEMSTDMSAVAEPDMGSSDTPVEECGGDSGGGEGMVQLSMQDLISLIKHLEKGTTEPQHSGDMVIGEPGEALPNELMDTGVGEEYGNSAAGDAGPVVKGIDAVTFSGNDMNSKGKASPLARAPGTNSLRQMSEMQARLAQYYDYVKSR